MINEEYISKKEDKFIINRVFDGVKYSFGEFSSLEEAKSRVEWLERHGWPIRVEDLNNDLNDSFLNVSFKVGKSYKHGFMVLTRHETEDLIPRLPYETDCDIVLDDIKAKIKLNVLLRLIITSGNEELREYLKQLSEKDPNKRANVKILLNKEDENPIQFNIKELLAEKSNLEKELQMAKKEIDRLNKLLEEHSAD